MALYLLQNLSAKTVKTAKNLVVAAASAAEAKLMAASHFNSDSSWASATATALAGGTLDDASSMVGWKWVIHIVGGAAQTVTPLAVTVTGSGTDDLDDLAAKLVIALNATADIANASYSAPNLTLASIADGIGDAAVTVQVYPPSGDTRVDLSSLLTGTITDEGIAAAALVVALVADTVVTPEVLAEV